MIMKIISSVAKTHNFYKAPVTDQGKLFNADPAPDPSLIYHKPNLLKDLKLQ
jgi:hypothetical protein